jgi:hypothetical protein
MLKQATGSEPPSTVAVDRGPLIDDRSMQILEYLVASVAAIAAIALALLR